MRTGNLFPLPGVPRRGSEERGTFTSRAVDTGLRQLTPVNRGLRQHAIGENEPTAASMCRNVPECARMCRQKHRRCQTNPRGTFWHICAAARVTPCNTALHRVTPRYVFRNLEKRTHRGPRPRHASYFRNSSVRPDHCCRAAWICGWSGLIARLLSHMAIASLRFASSSSRFLRYSAMRVKPISFSAG